MKTALGEKALWIVSALFSLCTLAAEPVVPEYRPLSAQIAASEVPLLVPPRNSGPLVIEAAFYLQDIDEIDDEKETVEFNGVLSLSWRDKRQAFDPVAAGVHEKIFQGAFQFDEISPAWYPQVVLVNHSSLYEKRAVLLRVKPDGTSTLVETVNAIAKVNLNMRLYPFDRQRLEAEFEVLGFDSHEIALEAKPVPALDNGQEIQIPGWKLTNFTTSIRDKPTPYAGTEGVSSSFVMTMDVQRQSLFILRLVVFPLAVIVILSWSVFWMDRSSLGDRMSISFIGILTAVAYQNVVGDTLPQISFVTVMNAFLNISFLLMCATVLIHLIVDDLDKKGYSERGDLIDRRCRWAFPLVYFGALSISGVIIFIFF